MLEKVLIALILIAACWVLLKNIRSQLGGKCGSCGCASEPGCDQAAKDAPCCGEAGRHLETMAQRGREPER